MTAAFLVWLNATRAAKQRIRKQYDSNLPTGIV